MPEAGQPEGKAPEIAIPLKRSKEPFELNSIYKQFLAVFSQDPLIEEVKDINLQCYNETYGLVYTINKGIPYPLEKRHY